MEISEKELEEMIWCASSTIEGRDSLDFRGLPLSGIMYRQVRLANYGIADLISVSYVGRVRGNWLNYETDRMVRLFVVDVYELKREQISVSALLQACRYKTALRQMIDKNGFGDERTDVRIRLNLIGSSLDTKSDFAYLLDSVDDLRIYTFKFGFDGIWFECQQLGYHLSDSGDLSLPGFSTLTLRRIISQRQSDKHLLNPF